MRPGGQYFEARGHRLETYDVLVVRTNDTWTTEQKVELEIQLRGACAGWHGIVLYLRTDQSIERLTGDQVSVLCELAERIRAAHPLPASEPAR